MSDPRFRLIVNRVRRPVRRFLVHRRPAVVDVPTGRCPKCGEPRLVEWDPALGKWVCDVCSHQWREGPGRMSGRPGDPADDPRRGLDPARGPIPPADP